MKKILIFTVLLGLIVGGFLSTKEASAVILSTNFASQAEWKSPERVAILKLQEEAVEREHKALEVARAKNQEEAEKSELEKAARLEREKAASAQCTDKDYVCSNWSQCIDGWQSSENCELDTFNCRAFSSVTTKTITRECKMPLCAESDYKISDWGQCVHGIKERAVTKSISCDIPKTINIREACSPSICLEDSYNIVWTKCVNNKQYSSFIKNEDCVLGYVPPAEKDCVSPVVTPTCQESSFSYGAWTPCVDKTSMRIAVKKQKCIGNPVISKSCSTSDKITTQIKTNGILVKKLSGKILLQVESRGEAYYVNPKDGKSYYMADGNSAYSVMRNLGVGITNDNLNKINTDKNFAKKNAGKIFLQVEKGGEAYYIDFNGEAHYLKDGTAAYGIMRDLGLGITNSDLSKIAEGSL